MQDALDSCCYSYLLTVSAQVINTECISLRVVVTDLDTLRVANRHRVLA